MDEEKSTDELLPTALKARPDLQALALTKAPATSITWAGMPVLVRSIRNIGVHTASQLEHELLMAAGCCPVGRPDRR